MRRLLFVSLLAALSISTQAQQPTDYRITGKVFDEVNQGVEKVYVCALPVDYAQNPRMPCTFSDAHGNFIIMAGRPSSYTIFAEKTSAGYPWQRDQFYRDPAVPPLNVTLNETSPGATVSIPLGEKTGFVTGKIVDANTGLAVENARLTLCQVANQRLCKTIISKNADGTFNVAAAHVPFMLRITAEGYEDWWGPSGVGKKNAITVSPGTALELSSLLRRTAAAANRPLSEVEKQPLTNLPAPVLLSPADRIEISTYPRHTRLEWQPVEGAAYYLVEIDVCDGRDYALRECVKPSGPLSSNGRLGLVKVQDTSYEFDFVGRQPGRWRVWAIDGKGEEGFKSPWRIFFYLK
jgi:hypothetical protein